jgi:hypothetical protein
LGFRELVLDEQSWLFAQSSPFASDFALSMRGPPQPAPPRRNLCWSKVERR